MVEILETLKQNAMLQEKQEKAKDNNMVENETGMEDVDGKIN